MVDKKVQDGTTIAISPNRREINSTTYLDDFNKKENLQADIAEVFHENTKISQVNPKFRQSIKQFMLLSPESKAAFVSSPEYVDKQLISLPEENDPKMTLTECIRSRTSTRNYSSDPITMSDLSVLLKYGCGMVGNELVAIGEHSFKSRGYPSAGGFYPVEPYVIVLKSDELECGIYYYSAKNHGLRIINQFSRDELLEQVEEIVDKWTMDYQDASLMIMLTGSFWKSKIKYGPRGYRFTLLEAGHLMQNIQLIVPTLGLGSVSIGGLKEAVVDPLLEVNGVDESILYGCLIGSSHSKGENNDR